jgi:hypothetical protein
LGGEAARVRGRRLTLVRLIFVLIIISTVAVPFATAKERTTRDTSIKGSIRFELYGGYLMVASGSVGSIKGLHFLIDTGTSTTLLDSSIAQKLGLEGMPEDVDIVFFDGAVEAVHTWAPSIELGPLRVFHRPVLVRDLSTLSDSLLVHLDGIVGLDVLGQSPFEVDYRNRRIHFGHIPHLPIAIPLSTEQGLAIVDVEVNHATAHLLFDTGTPSLLIFRSKLPNFLLNLKEHRRKHDNKLKQNPQPERVSLPAFRLGEAEFPWQQAIVSESRDECGLDFDGVLSPAALRIDAFSVDLERGALELRVGM